MIDTYLGKKDRNKSILRFCRASVPKTPKNNKCPGVCKATFAKQLPASL